MAKRLILALLLLAGFTSNLKAQGIVFEETSWKEILTKAQKEHKLVFLDAYASWCGPCKRMAAKVFTDPEVGKFYNSNFVCAKIDMEKGEGVGLAQKFNVEAYPTLIFVNANGDVEHRTLGALQSEQFIALGKLALDPENRLGAWIKRFEKGENSGSFLKEYLTKLEEAGMDYKPALEKYFKTQTDNALLDRQNWEMIVKFVSFHDSREFKYLVANRKLFVEKYGKDSVNNKINDVYFTGLMYAARRDKTMGIYNQLKADIKKTGYENAEFIGLYSDVELYRLKKDWPKYAEAAVLSQKKYPSENPQNLNNLAWTFYENVSSKKQLEVALGWIKKAETIDNSYMIKDTHAALLYKLGKKKLAQEKADEAIASAKSEGEDATGTIELLEKIKKLK